MPTVMSTFPEQPLHWSLELLPSGNFTARRHEWLRPGALAFMAMGVLLLVGAAITYKGHDYPSTVGMVFALLPVMGGLALTSLPQKSFSRRDSLVVAEDRRWPRSRRRTQRFDVEDIAEFIVHRYEQPARPPDADPMDHIGDKWACWEVHVRLHAGATVCIFTDLTSLPEAAWLHWLGTQLLKPGSSQAARAS